MPYIEVICIIKKVKLGQQISTDEYTFEFSIGENQDIKEEIKNRLSIDGITKIIDINIKSIKIVPSCSGCRSDQPNQLAHMDYGGCLYSE